MHTIGLAIRRCSRKPFRLPTSSSGGSAKQKLMKAPTSATTRAIARRSTTRTCSPAQSSPESSAATGDEEMASLGRRRASIHARPPTPGWVMAIRRAARPRLGGQLPHRLRPRLPSRLHRFRHRGNRCGAGMAPRCGLLPARPFLPDGTPSIRQPASTRSTLSRSPRGSRPCRLPHVTIRQLPKMHGGFSTSPAGACSAATGCRSSSGVDFGRIERFTFAGRSPRCFSP